MEDFIKAFIEFLTDLFAAISEFVGGNLVIGDILGGLTDVMGGETSTEAAAE